MPGGNDEERLVNTLTALLVLAEEGHTSARGAFRHHVRRLLAYLKKADCAVLGSEKAAGVVAAIAAVEAGQSIAGPWRELITRYLAGESIQADMVWSALEKHVRQGDRPNP